MGPSSEVALCFAQMMTFSGITSGNHQDRSRHTYQPAHRARCSNDAAVTTFGAGDFLEAGKKLLAGDTACAATNDQARTTGGHSLALEEAVADLMLKNRLLKKALSRIGKNGDEVKKTK